MGWRSSIGSGEAAREVERLLSVGGALFRAGRLEEAAGAYAEAVSRAPADVRPLSSLAVIEARLGRSAAARERLRRVVGLDPKLGHAWRNLAAVCQDLGRWEEAAGALRRTVDLDPSDVEARFGHAAALIAIGRTAAGFKAYRALGAEPACRLRALARLAIADPSTIGDGEAEEMAAAAKDEATSSEARVALWFAVGMVREARGEDDAAFDAFAAGNALKRAMLERGSLGSRPREVLRAHAAAAAHVAKIMTRATLADAGDAEADEIAPVFIVGMPRSGSSLIEQILASHPEVTGLGETAVLPRLLERAYPAHSGEPFVPTLTEIRRRYLQALAERGWEGRRRFVDKTLENFLHAGAIRRMFPRAVILESVREPMDTCLACWRQLFTRGAETLYDLQDIAAEYAIYAGLMDHWRTVGLGVVPVSLEELTADPQGRIRWLITEVCGLSWRQETQRFWATQRTVRTASAAQVRRPMNTSAHGRWRRYESRLRPLLEALAPFRAP